MSRANAVVVFGEALVTRALKADGRRLSDVEARQLAEVMRSSARGGLAAWSARVVAWALEGGDDRLLAAVRHVAGGVRAELDDAAREERRREAN